MATGESYESSADIPAPVAATYTPFKPDSNTEPSTYTVQFNANGGTGSMSDQQFTYGVA